MTISLTLAVVLGVLVGMPILDHWHDVVVQFWGLQ